MEVSGGGTPLRMVLEGQEPTARTVCPLPCPSTLKGFGRGNVYTGAVAKMGGTATPVLWAVPESRATLQVGCMTVPDPSEMAVSPEACLSHPRQCS